MVTLIRKLIIIVALFGLVLNRCNAQITYEELENLYGLSYFLFRNEQMVFTRDYILSNDIKSVSVIIKYTEVELESIYIYRRDGSLGRIKIPYSEGHSKKQKFKTFRFKNNIHIAETEEDSLGFVNNKTCDYLNNRINITQFVRKDTIRKEILVVNSDSIVVDHNYCMGMPSKTEVNVSSENKWHNFNNGLNVFNYNYKNGLLSSIISENSDFRIVYNYSFY